MQTNQEVLKLARLAITDLERKWESLLKSKTELYNHVSLQIQCMDMLGGILAQPIIDRTDDFKKLYDLKDLETSYEAALLRPLGARQIDKLIERDDIGKVMRAIRCLTYTAWATKAQTPFQWWTESFDVTATFALGRCAKDKLLSGFINAPQEDKDTFNYSKKNPEVIMMDFFGMDGKETGTNADALLNNFTTKKFTLETRKFESGENYRGDILDEEDRLREYWAELFNYLSELPNETALEKLYHGLLAKSAYIRARDRTKKPIRPQSKGGPKLSEIGKKIKVHRIEKGMTREELAAKSKLSKQELEELEEGNATDIYEMRLVGIVNTLDMDMLELTSGIETTFADFSAEEDETENEYIKSIQIIGSDERQSNKIEDDVYRKQLLELALASVPKDHTDREILISSFEGSYEDEAMAAKVGKPERTVKRRRAKIRKKINDLS